jgi:CheY-like chemotaxis protein
MIQISIFFKLVERHKIFDYNIMNFKFFECFKSVESKEDQNIKSIPPKQIQLNHNDNTKTLIDLIVDDSNLTRAIMRRYLINFDRKSDEVCNGMEALEIIKKKGKYDIIWMDIQMPIMNGIKCTNILRKEFNYNGIIIGVTGHVDMDSLIDCKNAGMNDVIAKPIDKKILQACIDKYQNLN